MRADPTNRLPAKMQAIVDALIAKLIAGGQADRALKAGDRVPPFRLLDSGGKMVDSVELLAAAPLVLVFYRGTWCSYCRLDLEALELGYDEIRSLGASLVIISPQTPLSNRVAQESLKISFPILSDAGGLLAELFGVRFSLPHELRPIFAELDVDLEVLNGEASWTLPMPARYVIRRDGVIAYAEINPDYTQRPEPSELYPLLKRLAEVPQD